jgi:hypothetical protein
METALDVLALALVALIAGLSWILPRRFGVVGFLGVQVLVVVVLVGMEIAGIATGRADYDDVFQVLGVLVQAILLNCLMLPIGLVALWRRRQVSAAEQRGFEVVRERDGPV